MAGKTLTCTYYVSGKQVERLTPEHLEKMAQRIGETLSRFYSAHPSEYQKIKTESRQKGN